MQDEPHEKKEFNADNQKDSGEEGMNRHALTSFTVTR